MMNLRLAGACCALLMVPLALAGVSGKAAESKAPGVDGDVLAALEKMGAELRSHGNIVLKADTTTEDVLGNGQKLQYAGTLDVQARRPDRFRIAAVSDLKDREFYYDGKAVTVYSPRLHSYASFDAPPTIAETIKRAHDNYGVEFPLSDLFTWGTSEAHPERLTSAFLVRPEHIDGKVCNHYALRQDNVDWQVWIAQDGPALACKLVITKTTDPSLPQYSAVLHWSFPATISEDTFAFAVPKDAQKIMMAKAN